MKKRAKDMR